MCSFKIAIIPKKNKHIPTLIKTKMLEKNVRNKSDR